MEDYRVKAINNLLLLLINCHITTWILIRALWNIVKISKKLNASFKNWKKNRETTEENSLHLQKEEEIKVIQNFFEKNKNFCDSLSSKLNEKEEKLTKLNVANFDRQMQ